MPVMEPATSAVNLTPTSTADESAAAGFWGVAELLQRVVPAGFPPLRRSRSSKPSTSGMTWRRDGRRWAVLRPGRSCCRRESFLRSHLIAEFSPSRGPSVDGWPLGGGRSGAGLEDHIHPVVSLQVAGVGDAAVRAVPVDAVGAARPVGQRSQMSVAV